MVPNDFLKSLKKDFTIRPLNESSLIMPKSYISTGNYAVNKIVSGSVFRGIPNNRITTFYGESGCVPFNAKVYILCKTELDIAEQLTYIKDDSIFQQFFDNTTAEEKVNMLRAIGYTMADIARHTGVTRATIYHRYKEREVIHSNSAKSTIYKFNQLLRKNLYQVPIQGIKLLNYRKIRYLILTPYGFRRCSNVIDKGEKESYVISVVDCPTTSVSKDHLLELEDGTFEFAENVYTAFKMLGTFDRKVKTIYGPRQIVSMREGGIERMCDLEVQDPHHSYFANDISGHNSGKSLIVSEIIINAIKNSNFDYICYLDSEGGILSDKFSAALTDEELQKVLHIPVMSIEDCTVKIHKIYDRLKRQHLDANGDPEKEPHVMVVLDSYSGLEPEAFAEKAVQDKVAADMGVKAKMKNQMIKSLMMTVVVTGCPLVMICHAYKSMNAMGPQKFNELSGGEGVKYASHIVVQSTKSRKRQEDANLGLKGGGSYYAGNLIRYITYKNRLVKEGLETTMYVDLNKGISKYAGLWDDAIRLGFIKQCGAWFQVPTWKEPEKKFRSADLMENDEVWKTFLPKMDEIFKVETAYGNDEFAASVDSDDADDDSADGLEELDRR